MIGKATVGNALVFRDLSNAEGIRSKALAARSGAWEGETNTWTVFRSIRSTFTTSSSIMNFVGYALISCGKDLYK